MIPTPTRGARNAARHACPDCGALHYRPVARCHECEPYARPPAPPPPPAPPFPRARLRWRTSPRRREVAP